MSPQTRDLPIAIPLRVFYQKLSIVRMAAAGIQRSAWQGMRKELLWAYAAPVPERATSFHPFEHSGGWLVLKGSARIRLKNRVITAKAGQWLFPPPAGVRRQSFAKGTEIISVRFLFT